MLVHHRDAVEWLTQLEPGSIDLLLADPPYGHGKLRWDIQSPALRPEWWQAVRAATKRSAAVVLFAQGAFTAKLMGAGGKMWRYNLVWAKNKSTGFLNARRMPMRSHEDLCVFYRRRPHFSPQMTTGHAPQSSWLRGDTGKHYGKTARGTSRAGATDRYPGSVLTFDVVNNDDPDRIHPSQKPVPLLRWLIRSYSKPGQLVGDCFAGSAATGVAAIAEGRSFMGCDMVGDYVSRANARLARFLDANPVVDSAP